MKSIEYKAYVVEEIEGNFISSIKTLNTENLSKNDVLIKVHYSSLNYKDALSATGNKGVTKAYPHTPGIDASGIVEFSESEEFKAGDKVIVTGNDLGMNTAGGFGQYISVPAEWVVKLPEGLSMKEAMILGTAGFTAGVQISRLSELVKPENGKILVSGATGGVGSVAVSILNKLGYQVTAISGKSTEHEFLKSMGANEIISRSDFELQDKRPILSAKYAGAVDTVGGIILENILKTLQPLGAVTTCGSVSSTQLNTTVFPFILRGISLIGVSSQNYPLNLRKKIWEKLSADWKPENLLEIYSEITLNQVDEAVKNILQGKLKGRTIIKMNE
ncbi:MAG: YhdH/YhfP family quinone oxidoreductase [Paludibacter sp.]|nr:YhdH/YhfP family quinone oxidoreductase [Paludibacter sp.]